MIIVGEMPWYYWAVAIFAPLLIAAFTDVFE